jgi:glycosyltransferase involved in cell wall biosynthesis
VVTTDLRVGLDLRSGGTAWIGGLYYLVNLAAAIRSLPKNEQPYLAGLGPADGADLDVAEFRDLLPVSRFAPSTGGPIRRLRSMIGGPPLGIARAADRLTLDVLFPTFDRQNTTAVVVPWIPDVQHLRQPENFTREERVARTEWARRMLHESPLVVVSSHAAGRDIAKSFPESSERLRVLHFHTVPVDEWLDDDPRETAKRYDLPDRFLFLPNQFWVHKDHKTAFDAVQLLRDRGTEICLACTGTPHDPRWPDHYPGLQQFIADCGLELQIRLLGRVPRQDYVQLIRASHAVVQPSRFEGWSSTVEDARAFGKPIVISDIDVHVEQAPARGRYFAAGDVEALADALSGAWSSEPVEDEHDVSNHHRELVATYARTALLIFAEAAETRNDRSR